MEFPLMIGFSGMTLMIGFPGICDMPHEAWNKSKMMLATLSFEHSIIHYLIG